MKKFLFIIPLVAAITLSCNKNSNTVINDDDLEISAKAKAIIGGLPINNCTVSNIAQLPWAQALMNGAGECQLVGEGATLTMYTYRGGQVFYYEDMLSSLGICTRGVYNCNGVKIIEFITDADVWTDFRQNRTNAKLLLKKPMVLK